MQLGCYQQGLCCCLPWGIAVKPSPLVTQANKHCLHCICLLPCHYSSETAMARTEEKLSVSHNNSGSGGAEVVMAPDTIQYAVVLTWQGNAALLGHQAVSVPIYFQTMCFEMIFIRLQTVSCWLRLAGNVWRLLIRARFPLSTEWVYPGYEFFPLLQQHLLSCWSWRICCSCYLFLFRQDQFIHWARGSALATCLWRVFHFFLLKKQRWDLWCLSKKDKCFQVLVV